MVCRFHATSLFEQDELSSSSSSRHTLKILNQIDFVIDLSHDLLMTKGGMTQCERILPEVDLIDWMLCCSIFRRGLKELMTESLFVSNCVSVGFSVAVIDEEGMQQLHITEVKAEGLASSKGTYFFFMNK